MENKTNKLITFLADNSHRIVAYFFWGYFLVFILFHQKLPEICTYVFFLLTGIYIGYKVAVLSIQLLRKRQE